MLRDECLNEMLFAIRVQKQLSGQVEDSIAAAQFLRSSFGATRRHKGSEP
jgi:hypothetical protein